MRAGVAPQLSVAGLSAAEAERKARLFAQGEACIESRGRPVFRWLVPGRIEVLGKHTDYAGGRSLLCATERGMCVVAAPRGDDLVWITDAVRRESIEFPLRADLEIGGGWATYTMTVGRRIARNFPGLLRGADIAIASDLPPAAGLSSSSVLVVAIFTAIAGVNQLAERDEYRANILRNEELAGYLGCVENGQTFGTLEGDCGVGTFGGSEDHTAILCCQAGYLSRYRFCPVRFEQRIRLPQDHVFVIASSGVVANKTGAAREAYNRASAAATSVLQVWNAASGRRDATLFAAVHHARDAAEKIHQALASSDVPGFSRQDLRRRFDQFYLESEAIVPAAAMALDTGGLKAFGSLVDRSQSAAERLLGNQVPQTIELARSARDIGAPAASAFGAGFGGGVWALVDRADAGEFISEWRTKYQEKFPAEAPRSEFFLTGAGPALTAISES